MAESSSVLAPPFEEQLERYRVELTAYCYRMLGSVDAEDAVQETFIRAWRAYGRFEGRSALRSWLYRIATNVCFDMFESRKRRARPMDLGPAGEPIVENLRTPDQLWIEPVPDGLVVSDGDPAEVVGGRESVRLAFVAALQRLPARQRAVLILCEVLRWKAAEVAELLETSVASVNSALQRARATLEASDVTPTATSPSVDAADAELLERYVSAFERYDMDALTSLIHEDDVEDVWAIEVDQATESMPTLRRQLMVYVDLAESGEHGPRDGLLPRVLIAVPDDRRLGVVRDLIGSMPDPAAALIVAVRHDIAVKAITEMLRE